MKRFKWIASSWGLAATAALAFAACASGPGVQEAQVRETYAALRSAEAIGADQVPAASLHLELAREEIAAARRLMKQDRPARARRALARAHADAELATTLTRARVARSEAQAAQERLAEFEGETSGSERPATQQPSEGSEQ